MALCMKFQTAQLHSNDLIYMVDQTVVNGYGDTPHYHDFYEIYIVLGDEAYEIINGSRITLKKHQIRLVDLKDVHHFLPTAGCSSCPLRNISIEKRFFEERLQAFHCNLSDLRKTFYLDQDSLSQLLIQTDLAFRQVNDLPSYQYIMTNIVDTLLIRSRYPAAIKEEIPDWLRTLCEQMEQPENHIAGMERLLALSGKSQSYLSRCFQKYYHITPTDFINQKRLKYAAMLLTTTRMRILDIAFESGFDSVAYFNKIFKNTYVSTPKEYRKKNQY